MGAVLDFFGNLLNVVATVLDWILSLISGFFDSLAAFMTGGMQLFQQITSSFSGVMSSAYGTPLALLGMVASIGVGYVVIRIIIHLL